MRLTSRNETEAMGIACPYCLARPTNPCRTRTGTGTTYMHSARLRQWMRQQQYQMGFGQ